MRSEKLSHGLLFASCAVVLSCSMDAGWNENERAAGSGDSGVSVALGEIAIDPTGTYLLAAREDELVYANLSSGDARVLGGLTRPGRVAFDHDGKSIFLTRGRPFANGEASLDEDQDDFEVEVSTAFRDGQLVRYDVASQTTLWKRNVELQYDFHDLVHPLIDVTDDDERVVLAYDDRVEVVDAHSGELLHATASAARLVVDVDVTPDQQHVVITRQHTWEGNRPETVLEVRDLQTFAKTEIRVPNCSSELVIAKDGRYAFLAPSSCRQDPVSVIDLSLGKFVRNLPGFGPVALAADGGLAIAFMDSENVDGSLFDDPAQIPDDDVRYHLMLIDTQTLRFDVIALGDDIPRYAVAPDGKLLLIDAPYLWDDGRVRLLDVHEKQLLPVLGPALELDNYAMTRDSSRVFVLDRGLFEITLSDRRAIAAPIDFTPSALNLTPDDSQLVLREDDDTLRLYTTHDGEIVRAIELGAASR